MRPRLTAQEPPLALLFPAAHCIGANIKLARGLGLALARFEELADCFYFATGTQS